MCSRPPKSPASLRGLSLPCPGRAEPSFLEPLSASFTRETPPAERLGGSPWLSYQAGALKEGATDVWQRFRGNIRATHLVAGSKKTSSLPFSFCQEIILSSIQGQVPRPSPSFSGTISFPGALCSKPSRSPCFAPDAGRRCAHLVHRRNNTHLFCVAC